ncbi:site-specific DNA-methyltransferase [Thiopseudomonas denitrificans]|uniref:Adenine-specific DNA-methyltransferase n=1 Tax=Thiopseudomonas denitrificans TaxID=1501432 RepID=A0A4R6U4Z8_9GAMM|nr:DNA methyltransferase [Thiopseudomonas denitrificans]TDQ38094.1 adenine-specific DNA-methyltransferase [Thiopseudomonas denitrificans]
MSRLTDLIAKAKARDAALGAELDREFKMLSSRLPFGLNFERHSPEAVELPLRPIRKGDKVRVLPERGSTKKGDQRLWQVKSIQRAKKSAVLELIGAEESETQTVALDDLVVVAEFRDTIYPGLVSTGKVQRGGDKPCHTVINGENYHVLKALTYTHRGNVDAIYIDPPYNTGAKDWKYNNDYVESDDQYRHSKWLAMMERRLLVAKELLNPVDSVLIVAIDEKEYLRLGLLLEQTFPDARIQMVTAVINPRAGVARPDEFTRTEEYLFIVQFGSSSVLAAPMSGEEVPVKNTSPIWFSLMRTGSNSSREARPNLFYPIWVRSDGSLHSVGETIPLGADREEVKPPSPDVSAVWPIRPDGSENTWQLGSVSVRAAFREGSARLNVSGTRFTVNYLRAAEKRRIENGEIDVLGKDESGALILRHREGAVRLTRPRTVWTSPAHDAGLYGSTLLRSLIPNRKFPFPKSLYAVEDALRFFVAKKSEAIVLDFFSGSGTTAHAVMRLNKQDGGRRQCISVTNNEVAADEQKALRKEGLRPGDPGWEKLGICDYITKPRVAAAITGKIPDGEPIKGDYKFTDEFPMSDGFEENAEFFTLTYETPLSVSHNLAFSRVAPLLWLRAGARGRRIEKLPADGWAVADAYALLNNVDAATPFIEALAQVDGLRIAYIVTDDDRRFQAIAKRLPDGVEPVRLYESYLTNFSFTNGE